MGEALPQLHPGTGHFSTELRALLQGTSVLGRRPVGGFCPSCPLSVESPEGEATKTEVRKEGSRSGPSAHGLLRSCFLFIFSLVLISK